jgi:predicted transcriptional regulator
MNYEKLKKLLIKNMNINEKTMHVLSMSEYVKRITVKEFFEVLENVIETVEKDDLLNHSLQMNTDDVIE